MSCKLNPKGNVSSQIKELNAKYGSNQAENIYRYLQSDEFTSKSNIPYSAALRELVNVQSGSLEEMEILSRYGLNSILNKSSYEMKLDKTSSEIMQQKPIGKVIRNMNISEFTTLFNRLKYTRDSLKKFKDFTFSSSQAPTKIDNSMIPYGKEYDKLRDMMREYNTMIDAKKEYAEINQVLEALVNYADQALSKAVRAQVDALPIDEDYKNNLAGMLLSNDQAELASIMLEGMYQAYDVEQPDLVSAVTRNDAFDDYVNSQKKYEAGQQALHILMSDLSARTGVKYKIITQEEMINNAGRGTIAYYDPNDNTTYFTDRISLEKVFHEFAHPFVTTLNTLNKPLFEKLYNDMMQTDLGKSTDRLIRSMEGYTKHGENHVREEIFVRVLEEIGRHKIDYKTGKPLLAIVREFLDWLAKFLFGDSKATIRLNQLSINTTMGQLADMLLVHQGKIEMYQGATFTQRAQGLYYSYDTSESLEAMDKKTFVDTLSNKYRIPADLVSEEEADASGKRLYYHDYNGDYNQPMSYYYDNEENVLKIIDTFDKSEIFAAFASTAVKNIWKYGTEVEKLLSLKKMIYRDERIYDVLETLINKVNEGEDVFGDKSALELIISIDNKFNLKRKFVNLYKTTKYDYNTLHKYFNTYDNLRFIENFNSSDLIFEKEPYMVDASYVFNKYFFDIFSINTELIKEQVLFFNNAIDIVTNSPETAILYHDESKYYGKNNIRRFYKHEQGSYIDLYNMSSYSTASEFIASYDIIKKDMIPVTDLSERLSLIEDDIEVMRHYAKIMNDFVDNIEKVKNTFFIELAKDGFNADAIRMFTETTVRQEDSDRDEISNTLNLASTLISSQILNTNLEHKYIMMMRKALDTNFSKLGNLDLKIKFKVSYQGKHYDSYIINLPLTNHERSYDQMTDILEKQNRLSYNCLL